jgi:hypothetical protein
VKNHADLSIRDLEEHPVWEFVNEEKTVGRALFVKPVPELPISHAGSRFISTLVSLNNGSRHRATLANLDLNNWKSTHHFLMISFVRDGRWFHLSRYFDFDYATNGPKQLAEFFGLSIDEVFPISYDVSGLAIGLPEVIVGSVPAEISDKLSRSEIIALAVG